MAKNSKVFDLIKHMNMSEKRYFKLFAEKHVIGSQNNYVLLFNTLDKEQFEIDSLIITRLEKKGYNCQYLSADKNYLYGLILKSLASYHNNRTKHIQIKELLIQIEILYQKGLFFQSLKLAEKAQSIAESTEANILLGEVLVWIRKNVGALNGPEDSLQTVNSSIDNLELIRVKQQYHALYLEVATLRTKLFRARSTEDLKALEELMKNPLLAKKSTIKDNLCLIRYHQIYAQYYFIKTNHEKEYEHAKKALEIAENSSFYVSEFPFDYLAMYSRLLSITKFIDKDNYDVVLDRFRKIKADKHIICKDRFNFQLFNYSTMSELAYCIYNGQWERGLGIIPDARNQIKKYEIYLERSSILTFLYLFAYINLATGRYREALKDVNVILNEFKIKDRPDLFHFSRILNLVIHFELQNVSLIPYIYKSTENYFKKRNSSYPTEVLLLDFFKKVTEDKDEKKLQNELKEIKDLLAKSPEVQKDKEVKLYFDIDKWIDSKLKNCTISDL